jgi:hypothetical protein
MIPKRDARALRRLLSLPRDPLKLAAVDRMIEAKTPEAKKEAMEALEKLCAVSRKKKASRR